MSLKTKFNNLLEKKGIESFLKRWTPSEDSSYASLSKSLKTYHTHSWIYTNHLSTSNSFLKQSTIEKNRMPEVMIGKDSIGHITFYSFNTGYGKYITDNDLKETETIVSDFLQLNKLNLKGLILDFRHHDGGWYLPSILGFKSFLNNSSLIYFGKKRGTKTSTDKGWVNIINNRVRYNQTFVEQQNPIDIPIAVIINRKTNSSGEIAAAIFKGRKKCKLFGTPTYGNLSSNESFSLNEYTVVLTTELLTTYGLYFAETLKPDIETRKPLQDAKDYIKSFYK
jgi:C-terminal processing protease CtpA/Prc